MQPAKDVEWNEMKRQQCPCQIALHRGIVSSSHWKERPGWLAGQNPEKISIASCSQSGN